MVKERNLQPRVDFCQTLIDMNDNLDDIIFTDESSVQLHNNRTTSYRPTGSARTSIPKPKHPLKVHVWAGISRRGPKPMLIFDGIMESTFFTNHILAETLLPFVKKTYPDGHRFQQDNDPKHRSAISKKFMEENGINWWNVWPSESPDLNPIEFVWNQMKRHVAKAGPRTKEELEECLQHFWRTEMTVELCNRYIDHLFKVAPVCVAMRGKATGDFPQRLFSERSREKSFGHFASLLQTESVTKKLESFNGEKRSKVKMCFNGDC